jgi:hypothetical protein
MLKSNGWSSHPAFRRNRNRANSSKEHNEIQLHSRVQIPWFERRKRTEKQSVQHANGVPEYRNGNEIAYVLTCGKNMKQNLRIA